MPTLLRVLFGSVVPTLRVACPELLSAHLASLPRTGRFIMAQSLHKGVAKRSIQQRVMAVRKEINAEGYVIHGWRYSAAVAVTVTVTVTVKFKLSPDSKH
jgi:hypothetical protein